MTDGERFAIAMERIGALERLLACYRTGSQPSEKLHRELALTGEALSDALRPTVEVGNGPDVDG